MFKRDTAVKGGRGTFLFFCFVLFCFVFFFFWGGGLFVINRCFNDLPL